MAPLSMPMQKHNDRTHDASLYPTTIISPVVSLTSALYAVPSVKLNKAGLVMKLLENARASTSGEKQSFDRVALAHRLFFGYTESIRYKPTYSRNSHTTQKQAMSDFDGQDDQDHGPDDESIEMTDLELAHNTPVRRSWLLFWQVRITPHHLTYALRVAVWISLLLLIVLVLPESGMALKIIGTRALSGMIPLPTPPLPPGYSEFYIEPAVPGTQVMVDDRPVKLPRISLDAPLKFGRGHHILRWFVASLPPQSCTFSVPFTRSDTCHYANELATYHTGQFLVILLNESQISMPSEG
jgi:hypothetical protein